MGKLKELGVNPEVLKWARETAGFNIPQVAQELKVHADYILEIEHRQRKVSKTLLDKLAKLYKRPITVLFLPKPPIEEEIPTDYRLLPGRKNIIGAETAYALREARKLQEVLSDLAERRSISTSFGIPPVSTNDNPARIGTLIRNSIGISISEQKKWPDGRRAFREWRGKLQRLGTFVIIEDFPREEARGFSLWHPDLVPMIIVSRNEAPVAQCFTLFHELAHILLRSDAMCLKKEDDTFLGLTEAWCNRVAAAALVPEDELVAILPNTGVQKWTLEDLYAFATTFRVSRHVIAIRLEHIGRVPKGYYNSIKQLLGPDDYVIISRKVDKTREFRRNIPRERLSEVGFAVATTILEACKSSTLSTMEAADILRVRPNKFTRLSELASAQSQRYG